jgi:hypothetical protein
MKKPSGSAAEAARLEAVALQLGVDTQTILQWTLHPSEGGRLLRRYLETGIRGDEPDPVPDEPS